MLHREFRRSIRGSRCVAGGLVQHHPVLISVHRTGRGKDDLMHTRCNHRVQQRNRPDDIVLPESIRLTHRHTNLDERREMHHRVGPMLFHDINQAIRVKKITLFQRSKLNRISPAVFEIVIGDRRMACRCQCFAGVRANITRTAGDQNYCQIRPNWELMKPAPSLLSGLPKSNNIVEEM